jgi:LmbE family N-acetylglucosaminyl deacetylase
MNMDFPKQRTLLVVAPHPDDEIFGCGGLIYRVKKAGGKVFVLYLTVGTTKDFSKKGQSTLKERMAEIERVSKYMGFDGYRVAFPGDDYHLQLDSLPQKQLIHEIERGEGISLEAIKPTTLAIPSSYDYNQDHRAANRAAITATRPVPDQFKHLVPVVMEYEFPYFTWTSEAERPSPNIFVSMDEKALKAKLHALSLYKSQMKVKHGPISEHGAETLARMRGIHAGTHAAEAFILRRSFI